MPDIWYIVEYDISPGIKALLIFLEQQILLK